MTAGRARSGVTRLWAAAVRRVARLSERARRVLLLGTAGTILMALLIAVALGWSVHRAAAARDETQAALVAARTDTERLLSIGVDTLDADLARARDVATQPFAAQFERTLTEVIVPGTRQNQLLTTTKVPRIALISSAPDRVQVLVFINQYSSSPLRPGPAQIIISQVREALVKVGDRWLISEFEVL